MSDNHNKEEFPEESFFTETWVPYSLGATVCLSAALSVYCVGQPQNVAGGLCWLRLPLEKEEVVKALR